MAVPPPWMDAGERDLAEQAAAAGRDWTFGWAKLAADADLDALHQTLSTNGAEMLGHAGDLVRVRLPADSARLAAIAAADPVAGIGAVPPARKITDTLAERASADVDDRVPVWITLMADDPYGRWRNAIQAMGAEVGRFDASIRTYPATIPLRALAPLAQADFVLAIESIGRVEATLELAAPAMGADAVRSYDASEGTFVGAGGASVPVGVMDTGLNVDHPDIGTGRNSICGANFADLLDSRVEDQDLWFDFGEHGTHVTGIVVGNGAANRDRAGMAPLVRDIRFAKALSSFGSASALGWNRAMDWFAVPTACGGDGVPRKALVINSSLGLSSDAWEGRSAVERKIDASVWAARQLFVTSAANAAHFAYSSMAGAKNVLSVGAAQNIGDIAVFSSHGPTADGRLMPKIVGTGVGVASAQGVGARDGYNIFSGTSMSSPAVAGVAALVMDAVPQLKEEPAALRARLMASAVKPEAFLDDPAAFPPDNTDGPGTFNNVFGLGKVSARTAVLSRDADDGWTGGSAAFDMDGTTDAFVDIEVPAGARRLDVVLTWDEPPADTITSPVLHDLDLFIFHGLAIHSSRSRIDNVEWIVLRDPAPGMYRITAHPHRIHGATPRAGLAWTVVRGDPTPSLAVAADAEEIRVGPGVPFEIEATLTTDAYVAAGANLRIDCRADVGSGACDGLAYEPAESGIAREDGLARTLARDGTAIVVGEIGPDEAQKVTLRFSGGSEGAFRLDLSASAWNAAAAQTSVAVVVGEPESDPPTSAGLPPNDSFADAIRLDGTDGETAFDLVAATPDPGEPPGTLFSEHPVRDRSLWYQWTATESVPVRFAVARAVPDTPDGPPGDYADAMVVQAFREGPLATLEPLGRAQPGGGTVFFAEAGDTFRIRLSVSSAALSSPSGERKATPELILAWAPGDRPANDDYAFAEIIGGDSGEVDGNNQAATVERGELMGGSNPEIPFDPFSWSGSVWYRWTAPASGDYRFASDRSTTSVAAFAGGAVAEARMVSGIPRAAPGAVVFPATEGVEYRIGVATISAELSAAPFRLSWAPGAREFPANDDFAAAARTFGDQGGALVAFDDLTVEHGEPAGTGTRSAWWTWQPQADGRYTWRAEGLTFIKDDAPVQMSVFAGDALDSLETVGVDTGDETMQREIAFDARADTAYRVALGIPRDAAQTSLPPVPISLRWGPTPENDDYARAAALAGASGSVVGSNEFATTEKGERTGTLGDSSLWWTFEPEETTWMRFAVAGPGGSKLAVYRIGADGALEPVTVSRRLGEPAAVFHAEAGSRYVIRYGVYYQDIEGSGGGNRGVFELGWSAVEPPALLRHVATFEAGGDDGFPLPFGPLGAQAFNGDGTELYVWSPGGLLVFARDASTGALSWSNTLATPLPPDTQLLWDDAAPALLAASCAGWTRFAPREGGGLEYAGTIDRAPCPTEPLLAAGDFVHNVVPPWMIETYRFDEGRGALGLEEVTMVHGLSAATMTADSANVYAVTYDGTWGLAAMERDAADGSLHISALLAAGDDGDGPLVEGLADVRALAAHGSHLFAATEPDGAGTLVFDLADRANPALLGTRPSFLRSPGGFCGHTVARSRAAVDVVCSGTTVGQFFTVQIGRDDRPLASDLLFADGRGRDFFDNPVPRNADVLSVAASPDGRHLYVAGGYLAQARDPATGRFGFRRVDQLIAFERVHGSERTTDD